MNNLFDENIKKMNFIDLKQFISNYCTKFESCLLYFFNTFLNSENN